MESRIQDQMLQIDGKSLICGCFIFLPAAFLFQFNQYGKKSAKLFFLEQTSIDMYIKCQLFFYVAKTQMKPMFSLSLLANTICPLTSQAQRQDLNLVFLKNLLRSFLIYDSTVLLYKKVRDAMSSPT
ncbi:hypothetical protein EDC96DRAFT_564501 [Choanephora cucurbitarum]|nr:hypothetical protein EDC96DRAFT_564501 [Choanephora cucurbitarum]